MSLATYIHIPSQHMVDTMIQLLEKSSDDLMRLINNLELRHMKDDSLQEVLRGYREQLEENMGVLHQLRGK